MKIINISLEWLRHILKSAEENKNLPLVRRTYKINRTDNYYLAVKIKKQSLKGGIKI